MKVLLLAPQPFYQERGTPVAVKLLVETLCGAGHRIDLLTYHEGEDVHIDGLTVSRIRKPPFVTDVPIGFSWKKIICDLFLFLKMRQLLEQNKYHVIHAVEESILLTLMAPRKGKKLIYDMDSSMADQLIEKWRFLKPVKLVLSAFEGLAVRRSDVVLPVCKYLAEKAHDYAPDKAIQVLEDVPLTADRDTTNVEDLRSLFDITGILALYVGNLEHYQGVDLMLEAVAQIAKDSTLHLVIIGGKERDIVNYKLIAQDLDIAKYAHFLGPQPIAQLNGYLEQADILISPRIKGGNTPMKIYSYLASGKPIVATDIESHTQVLDDSCAMLAKAEPSEMASALQKLALDFELRGRIGRAGQRLAQDKYSREAYSKKLLHVYASLEGDEEPHGDGRFRLE
jgi:glycosyltransferase involved in cell wall biosynthesis